MTLRSVFLFASAGSHSEKGPAATALRLAQDHDACLFALVRELDVTSPGGSDRAAASGTAATAERIEAIAAAAGVSARVATSHSHAHGVHEVVAEHARLHDLIVIGADPEGILSERDLAEYLLFESGRPVLVVPAGWEARPIRKALVAWDASRGAARALGDAMPLLENAEQTLFLTFPDDKTIATSMTREEVEEALRPRRLNATLAEASRGSRSIGDALNDEAREMGADLLVMGGYGRPKWRELVLGGATRGILEKPLLPTLLSH